MLVLNRLQKHPRQKKKEMVRTGEVGKEQEEGWIAVDRGLCRESKREDKDKTRVGRQEGQPSSQMINKFRTHKEDDMETISEAEEQRKQKRTEEVHSKRSMGLRFEETFQYPEEQSSYQSTGENLDKSGKLTKGSENEDSAAKVEKGRGEMKEIAKSCQCRVQEISAEEGLQQDKYIKQNALKGVESLEIHERQAILSQEDLQFYGEAIDAGHMSQTHFADPGQLSANGARCAATPLIGGVSRSACACTSTWCLASAAIEYHIAINRTRNSIIAFPKNTGETRDGATLSKSGQLEALCGGLPHFEGRKKWAKKQRNARGEKMMKD